jgi:hypothetical protein
MSHLKVEMVTKAGFTVFWIQPTFDLKDYFCTCIFGGIYEKQINAFIPLTYNDHVIVCDITLLWANGSMHMCLKFHLGPGGSMSYVDMGCFNATFSNISAISWQPVLVVEEAGIRGENHRSCKFWSADDSSLPSVSTSPPAAGKKSIQLEYLIGAGTAYFSRAPEFTPSFWPKEKGNN